MLFLLFDCGNADDEQDLAIYIKRYALTNDLLGVAKTFVAIADDLQVLGYYTLSASLIDRPSPDCYNKHNSNFLRSP